MDKNHPFFSILVKFLHPFFSSLRHIVLRVRRHRLATVTLAKKPPLKTVWQSSAFDRKRVPNEEF
jgi:hypothetical protein